MHRCLVLNVANRIASCYPHSSITTDVQKQPGDAVPPKIGRFRPDVYATVSTNLPTTIIAEAKTAGDLDNKHTDSQISAFIHHLERKKSGESGVFILAVSGICADQAKTLLRFVHQIHHVTNTNLIVFDSHDLWELDLKTRSLWHLI